jgi:hypothetical protein
VDGAITFSNTPVVELTNGVLAIGMGIVHDSAGRVHIQYNTDEEDPGMNGRVYYKRAE